MKAGIKLRIVIVFALLTGALCGNLGKRDARTDTLEFSPGKRTFLISKLLLMPTLATIGLKFLFLLPVFLSKIALLSVMNFVGANLNLLISGAIWLRNYFTGQKAQAGYQKYEDHRVTDHDYMPRPSSYQPMQMLEVAHDNKNNVYNSWPMQMRGSEALFERHLYKNHGSLKRPKKTISSAANC